MKIISTAKLVAVVAVVAVVAAIAWMTHAGIFYQTGTQWFQACWAQRNANRPPGTLDEKLAWAKCEPMPQRVAYTAGYEFPDAAPAVTAELEAVKNACPRRYLGFQFRNFVIDIIERDEGTTVFDGFIPAETMVLNKLSSKWPNCPSVARASGFPMIVWHQDGWHRDYPCEPCKVEEIARQKEHEKLTAEVTEWNIASAKLLGKAFKGR